MSGRIKPLYAKRRSQKKAPGAKPNATRQRFLAVKRKRYRRSALFARREVLKAALRAQREAQAADAPDTAAEPAQG